MKILLIILLYLLLSSCSVLDDIGSAFTGSPSRGYYKDPYTNYVHDIPADGVIPEGCVPYP